MASSPAGPTSTGQAYTCCAAADVNRDYEPGQTLTIHWIVAPGKLSRDSSPRQIELNARLTGPYATVGDLKAAGDLAGELTFAAPPVRPSGQAGEQPVSSILIPPSAPAGYYNLVTSVTAPAGTTSGATVIRVISKT